MLLYHCGWDRGSITERVGWHLQPQCLMDEPCGLRQVTCQDWNNGTGLLGHVALPGHLWDLSIILNKRGNICQGGQETASQDHTGAELEGPASGLSPTSTSERDSPCTCFTQCCRAITSPTLCHISCQGHQGAAALCTQRLCEERPLFMSLIGGGALYVWENSALLPISYRAPTSRPMRPEVFIAGWRV